MLLQLFERAALLLIILFFLTRIPSFKQILQKESLTTKEFAVVTLLFCTFALFGTYSGIDVEGSLVNVRIIVITAGGILFGPWVGLVVGVVSGIHRYLIDIGGVTSIPCLITSIIAGLVSGYIHLRTPKAKRWFIGILAGMACEALTMLLIIFMAQPTTLGNEIVSRIATPMILGQLNVGLIILLIQNVESEREGIAAQQAKLALDIANKALPYFRSINTESLHKICSIIKEDIQADAVAITDSSSVLAYVGFGEDRYQLRHEIISDMTKQTIRSGEFMISNHALDDAMPGIQSLLIIPLKEREEVTGTLKIYYRKAHKITYPLQTMAVGLSQIISTLMEVSRVEEIKEMANKAELKALQTTIQPHFLFNALNAIGSSIRTRPDQARELIVNLSGYLRYNLELTDELIDIHKELEQVRNYVEIEKARFGNRLHVVYDVDEVAVKIPSLIIQPLVENAIVHGILKERGPGTVTIYVKDTEEYIRIGVRDTGVGIREDIIKQVIEERVPPNHIGLFNVYKRVKLIFGHGVTMERLDQGTNIFFDIQKETR
ncbi:MULTISPECIES: sensor histidine kinase [unclassified Paenibacillus]|uniref:sensor histidine kinase n=1 Tax=unclassified Paenibacillus TaxID=185978 RepID=UPI00048FD861|nr:MULTISPECIES: sensor histidine kinase [unclassified Paenibacillus]SDE53342.1 two-component system, LytT family, sensor kinase [Paenibacillus sp. cl6col]